MTRRIHRANGLRRYAIGVYLLVLLAAGTAISSAHEEWFRSLDLEPRLREATLVLVARVVNVSETRIMLGGKFESALLQFKFAPLLVLKGVFSRESLSLTSQDLGAGGVGDIAPLEIGQVRLLILGRSRQGYEVQQPSMRLDESIPPLSSPSDGFVETTKVLLAVNATPDRSTKVALLLAALRPQRGPATVPLLTSLRRRSLLAAQTSNMSDAVSRHLSDPSPAVREQAARTLDSIFEADYLDQPALRQSAVRALMASVEKSDSNVPPRVAALRALGTSGAAALDNQATKPLFRPDLPGTFTEQAARFHAIGQLKLSGERDTVLAVLRQTPLDAPSSMQSEAEWALVRLDPANALKEITLKVTNRYDAGYAVATEISALGDIPLTGAASALLEISKQSLDYEERLAFVTACRKVAENTPDSRLVPPLAGMLAPHQPDVRSGAIEALQQIDTDDAAKALQPHLSEEANLGGKLKIAEFLGRHGIRDGYPYAIEHMSEPYLREQAIAALVAIRDPRTVAELRRILNTSNDVEWNSAAVRGLARLGAADLAPQFLEMARNPQNPLAPSALIALGDLHETRAIALVRAGLRSRSNEMLIASARAAGNLAALPAERADDIRDQLASLLADPGAPLEARAVALDSLLALKDQRLDAALSRAVLDGELENLDNDLLNRIEKLLRDRKIKLTLPQLAGQLVKPVTASILASGAN